MSNLIYQGDTIANFGNYLPVPYIERITIGEGEFHNDALAEAGTGPIEANTLKIELSILINSKEEVDNDTFMNQLEGLNFYWMWDTQGSDDTHPDILSGETLIFDRADSANDWADPKLFSFTIGTDAGTDGCGDAVATDTALYDADGNKILKFTYSCQTTLPLQLTTSPHTYVYAWSTTEAFEEAYWEIIAEGIATGSPSEDIDASWRNFLRTEISDIAYEPVIVDFKLPDISETIWVDESDAAYAETGLQSIQGAYYKPSNITHEEIVSSFQGLVDEYQTQAATDASLLDAINNISYIIEEYGSKVDLLPRLNEFRKAFPSKTSTTVVGQLYGRYRKKIYTANSAAELGGLLYKKVVTSSKVIDLRETGGPIYSPPDDDICATSDCEASSDDCMLVSSDFRITREYFGLEGADDTDLWGSVYGFFFFDYEKAFYYLANIVEHLDVAKVAEYLGKEVFNMAYRLSKVKLTRKSGGYTQATLETTFTYDGGYPQVVTMVHDIASGATAGSEVGTSSLEVTYPGEMEGVDTRTCGAKTFLILRDFDIATESGVGLDGYRLMAFEFQDLMAQSTLMAAGDAVITYDAEVTIEDSTMSVGLDMITAFNTYYDEFLEYYSSAGEPCNYNAVDGRFNDFFADEMTATYPDSKEAPWVLGPTLYYLYKDILDNTYSGDINEIMDQSMAVSDRINPTNGTLEQLNDFADNISTLYVIVQAIETSDDSTEHTYSCTFAIDPDQQVGYYNAASQGLCDMAYASIATNWEAPDFFGGTGGPFELAAKELEDFWLGLWTAGSRGEGNYASGAPFDALQNFSNDAKHGGGGHWTNSSDMFWPQEALLEAFEWLKEVGDNSCNLETNNKYASYGGRDWTDLDSGQGSTGDIYTDAMITSIDMETIGDIDAMWWNLWLQIFEEYWIQYETTYKQVLSENLVLGNDTVANNWDDVWKDEYCGGVDITSWLLQAQGWMHTVCSTMASLSTSGEISDMDLWKKSPFYESGAYAEWPAVASAIQNLIDEDRFPIWTDVVITVPNHSKSDAY